MKLRIAAIAAALLVSFHADAQSYRYRGSQSYRIQGDCPNGQCPNREPAWMIQPPVFVPNTPEAAVTPPAAPQASACQCNCTCEGCICKKNTPGAPVKAPQAGSPVGSLASEPPPLNFGLDTERMTNPQASRAPYCLNGKPCSKERAFQALAGADGVPDDSKSFRLTAIGTKEQTAAIEADVKTSPLFADLAGSFTFQAYEPTDPMIAALGFAPGAPSVNLQSPDGTVLARWETYAPESVIAEVRKSDSKYDPSKDKQPLKTPAIVNSFKSVPIGYVIAGAIVLAALFLKKS